MRKSNCDHSPDGEIDIIDHQAIKRRVRSRRVLIYVVIALVAGSGIIATFVLAHHGKLHRPFAFLNPPPAAPAPVPVPKIIPVRVPDHIPQFDVSRLFAAPADAKWNAFADPFPGDVPAVAKLKPRIVSLNDVSNENQHVHVLPDCRLLVMRPLEEQPSDRVVVDGATGRRVGRLPNPELPICIDPGQRLLATAHRNRIKIADIVAGQHVAELLEDERRDKFGRAQLAGTDKLMLSINENDKWLGSLLSKEYRIWDWKKNRLLISVSNPLNSVCCALSPNGRYLAFVGHRSDDDKLTVPCQLLAFDFETGKIVGKKDISGVAKDAEDEATRLTGIRWVAAAFSSDGRRFAVYRMDGFFYMWDWTTGNLVAKSKSKFPFPFLRPEKDTSPAFGIYDENLPFQLHHDFFSCRTGSKINLQLKFPEPEFARSIRYAEPGMALVPMFDRTFWVKLVPVVGDTK